MSPRSQSEFSLRMTSQRLGDDQLLLTFAVWNGRGCVGRSQQRCNSPFPCDPPRVHLTAIVVVCLPTRLFVASLHS